MRILVHDYSGHPFQVELSRALAKRGHEVLHLHCSSYETGKGAVYRRENDPSTFAVASISLDRPIGGTAGPRRVPRELAYGRAFVARAAAFAPDVVLSSNDPLFAKARAAWWCRRTGTPWVFWLQDIYSVGMTSYAASRLGRAGRAFGYGFETIERNLARRAAAVVAITEGFTPTLRRWHVPDDRCHVIENWAPLGDLAPTAKDNPWARRHALAQAPVLLYSGTLGRKHDPGLLVALARRLEPSGARVVVISAGASADWLAGEQRRLQLENLVLLGYQPYEELAQVMGTADVLLTILEGDAGVFSVPSKILTYLCAGRPILASMPPENLGAATIEQAGAGIVVAPGDTEGFLAAAQMLLDDEGLCRRHGASARAYAERVFDIDRIGARFERVLEASRSGGSRLAME